MNDISSKYTGYKLVPVVCFAVKSATATSTTSRPASTLRDLHGIKDFKEVNMFAPAFTAPGYEPASLYMGGETSNVTISDGQGGVVEIPVAEFFTSAIPLSGLFLEQQAILTWPIPKGLFSYLTQGAEEKAKEKGVEILGAIMIVTLQRVGVPYYVCAIDLDEPADDVQAPDFFPCKKLSLMGLELQAESIAASGRELAAFYAEEQKEPLSAHLVKSDTPVQGYGSHTLH